MNNSFSNKEQINKQINKQTKKSRKEYIISLDYYIPMQIFQYIDHFTHIKS